MIQLILGGARSGKSRLAEQKAKDSGKAVIYIATAQALDTEMHDRIEHHQAQRPSEWVTVEESIHLAEKLKQLDQDGQVILVDCLTLWMSHLLMHDGMSVQEHLQTDLHRHLQNNLQATECEKLIKILTSLKSDVILVSNETGLGVVPMGQISRKFVDETGRLHQQIGQLADEVIFCVAGFPMLLKGAMK